MHDITFHMLVNPMPTILCTHCDYFPDLKKELPNLPMRERKVFNPIIKKINIQEKFLR